MGKQIFIEGENAIDPTDYEAKYNEVINTLENELFYNITEETTTQHNNNTGIDTKYRVKKNEILPLITNVKVSAKLNECLRIYRPLSTEEVKLMQPSDILVALKFFMKLITHINTYCVFVPDKQLFSSFAGFNVNTYNQLLQDNNYVDIMNSIEDYLISIAFTASSSNLVDAKTTLDRLKTQAAGHSLQKAQIENLTLVQNNYIDRTAVNEKLAKFNSLLLDNKK